MNALERCSPLFTPSPVFVESRPRVELWLDEPLWEQPDMKKLVAWCAYANILAETEESSKSGKEATSDAVFEEIERMCRLISPNRSMQWVLRETRMLDLNPSLARLMHGTPQPTVKNSKENNPGMEYLAYVSLLNQLLTMSGQLYDDAAQQHNHKYIAHQIALLYQCLNQVRGETKVFKKRIEERFEEIKQVTEQSSAPHLNDFYKRWLRDLSSDVRDLVATFPPNIYSKMAPIADNIRPSQVALVR